MTRLSDYDAAGGGRPDFDPRGRRAQETHRDLVSRMTTEAAARAGLDLEPEEQEAPAAPPEKRQDEKLSEFFKEHDREVSGEAQQQREWDARSAKILQRLGLEGDPRVIALANRRWTSEGAFWNAVSELASPTPTPRVGAAPAETPGLDEARSELGSLLRNPGMNTKKEAANRARRAELTKIIDDLEKAGFGNG